MPEQLQHMARLFLREARLVAKDHSLLLTLLVAPLLYAFFYGSIYSYKEEEEVKLALVDEDQSSLSRTLAEQLNNTQIADVSGAYNMQAAQEQLYRGRCQGILYIPAGLEASVMDIRQANIVLAVNAARFLPSSELMGAVTQAGLTVGAGVRLRYYEMKGMTSTIAMQETMPVRVDYRPLFNERASYGAFLLPGLLALILQQTLLIGLAESVALERQRRQLPLLLQESGSASVLLWGKGLFYLLLFAAYATFFMTVNYTVLDIPFRGGAMDMAVTMLLFLLVLIPLGICLGSLFPGQLLAAQLMAFSTYPVFLVTGYVWPYQALPQPVQWLSALLPTTPFIRIYQSIGQTGGTLGQNAGPLLHLLALWALYVLLALWRLKRCARAQ